MLHMVWKVQQSWGSRNQWFDTTNTNIHVITLSFALHFNSHKYWYFLTINFNVFQLTPASVFHVKSDSDVPYKNTLGFVPYS